MAIDINNILTGIYNGASKPTNTNKSANNTNSNVNAESIFAQASELVSAFKEEQNNKTKGSGSSKSGLTSGLSYSQIAGMSTSDFLNYAYDNKANSGYKESSNDSSGVDLPMLVRYKTQVVSTAGKSFMQVVAKLAAKFPHRSEEEIAAELMTKYGKFDEKGNLIKEGTNSTSNNSSSNTGQSGISLDLSA